MPLLEIEELSVDFPTASGVMHAVDRVSLTVKEGEVLGIVGESGSGKSVTMLAAMGLVAFPGQVKAKRLAFAGQDLLELSSRERRRLTGKELAMIFQEPTTSLNPCFTIGTQMREAILVHQRISQREAHDAAVASLAALALPDPEKCMGTFQHLLSGGMRQRVMIAMSLASHPSLLIADEPTTALDVTIQAQIVAHLKRLQEQTGMAILFITHNLGLVAEIADRAMVMYAGEIVETAEVRTLFADPRMPYTHGLLRSLPRLGHKRERADRIVPIPGSLPSPITLPPGCTFHPRCGHAVAGVCDMTSPALEPCGDAHQVRCARWRDIEWSRA